jgi:hypothetical protein
MIPPATISALRDRRLRRRDLMVYSLALEVLAFHEPRPLKLQGAERVLRMDAGDVSRALRRLVEHGYLVRGPRDGTLQTYLLRLSLPPANLVSEPNIRFAG